MTGVTAASQGLVAVGSEHTEDREPAVFWTSIDGTTWSRVPRDEAVSGGESIQVMNSVTARGPGFVAVGADGSRDDLDAAVWTVFEGIS